MEKEKENADTTRPSLKTHSPFNNYELWKHKLRENCFKRVRDDRTRLLWKLRSTNNRQQKDDDIRIFEDIMSDEFNKINTDDLLWEDPQSTSLYQGECQDILLEMQTIFYQDLNSLQGFILLPFIILISYASSTSCVTADLESDIQEWEDQVDQYLARAVYEHMHLNADNALKEEIWCPVCKQGQLKDSRNLIHCTHCELKLKKANELTLDFLRDRLAEVHMEHLDRGCRLKPKFCIKTKFSLTALYISCDGCDTFEVVI